MAQTIAAQLTDLAVPIGSVRPHPRNPNQGNIGEISVSLTEFSQYAPIVVQRSTGHIVKGNHTYLAARALGWTAIAANVMDLDDTQALAILVGDNRHSELGTRDQDALGALLTELAQADALLGTGYDGDDVDQILADLLGPTVGLTDPDAVPGVPDEPITQPGDLWVLGRHRVCCGDSTVATDVDRLMDGARADLLWTDPPYGVAYEGKTADALTLLNDDMNGEALRAFLRDALNMADGAMREGAAYYIAHPDIFAYEFIGAVRDVGWRQARPPVVLWVKDTLVMGRGDYHSRSEPILYGWKPGAAHHSVKDRTQDNVWEIDRPTASREHPTMKPLNLIVRAVENSTNPGALLLDLFGGSGSTLIAAEQTGRTAYLMELDAKYVDVICRRFYEFSGVDPIRESDGARWSEVRA